MKSPSVSEPPLTGGGVRDDAFGNYMQAQAERREAYERFCRAEVELVNAQIRERLAEIKSQYEPLAGLLTRPMSERDRLYSAAYYVVTGRTWVTPEQEVE